MYTILYFIILYSRSYAELNIKKYVDYMGNVYYIALEDIAPYTELLVNYQHSFNIMPSLFWSGQARHNLTCKLYSVVKLQVVRNGNY